MRGVAAAARPPRGRDRAPRAASRTGSGSRALRARAPRRWRRCSWDIYSARAMPHRHDGLRLNAAAYQRGGQVSREAGVTGGRPSHFLAPHRPGASRGVAKLPSRPDLAQLKTAHRTFREGHSEPGAPSFPVGHGAGQSRVAFGIGVRSVPRCSLAGPCVRILSPCRRPAGNGTSSRAQRGAMSRDRARIRASVEESSQTGSGPIIRVLRQPAASPRIFSAVSRERS